MTIIRILKKLSKDISNLAKCYGFKYALYNLIWWLCFYSRFPFTLKLSTYALAGKTHCLDLFLEEKYKEKIAELNMAKETPPVTNYKLWFFWGQGENEMPILVKKCYLQLKKLHTNVELVTAENISCFIELPREIYNKVINCELSWAHFSDIIRTSLLAKYGGLWIDSTVWIHKSLPIEKLQTMPFFSANYKTELNNRSVRFWTSYDWNWSTWCMGSGVIHHKLFTFVSQIMTDVAVNQTCWPDYVFQDYLIYYVCRHCNDVRKQIETVNIKNPYRNKLASLMNQPYNETEFRELTRKEIIFKLSFRAIWPTEVDGKITYYGKFLKGEL